jgi:hypothetical protein
MVKPMLCSNLPSIGRFVQQMSLYDHLNRTLDLQELSEIGDLSTKFHPDWYVRMAHVTGMLNRAQATFRDLL